MNTLVKYILLSVCFLGQIQLFSSPLRIAIPADPQTFDPRQARDLITVDIVSLLFSGLTKLSPTGEIEHELAESIESSPDGLTYRITLKKACWSDLSPITAEDFVYSWKLVLEKERACPNSALLFWIKNAQKAHEGTLSLDKVGARALNPQTVEVKLERPCHFFTALLATPAFLAVQKGYAESTAQFDGTRAFPVSGPYRLSKRLFQQSVDLVKNDSFWNKKAALSPQEIHLLVVSDGSSVTLFDAGDLDWIGSPMGTLPTDALESFESKNKLLSAPSAGTAFIRLNVTHPLLKDARLRKALSLAMDKKKLVDHVLQGGQIAAKNFAPPCLLPSLSAEVAEDDQQATALLEAYCKEHGVSPKKIILDLIYAPSERATRIALFVQQKVQEKLGITIELHPCDAQRVYSKISQLDYGLAVGNWFADYFDPHAFYSLLEYARNGMNNTGWESAEYRNILALSSQTSDANERIKFFHKLEQILANEMPIIPLFYTTFNYVKEPTANELALNPLGRIDISRR